MDNKKSILDKVDFLLLISKKGNCTDKELEEIKSMISEHSNDIILGKVFGYSVSDYAIATLNWLKMYSEYEKVFQTLPLERRGEIQNLISSKLYNEY